MWTGLWRPGSNGRYCINKVTWGLSHYIDVIMTTIACQITSLTVVYSIIYSDADQRKHQSSASLAFVWGSHRDRWIPRAKGQLRGKCFHLMTSSWQPLPVIVGNICVWFSHERFLTLFYNSPFWDVTFILDDSISSDGTSPCLQYSLPKDIINANIPPTIAPYRIHRVKATSNYGLGQENGLTTDKKKNNQSCYLTNYPGIFLLVPISSAFPGH